MDRNTFEQVAAQQNQRRAQEVAEARTNGAACNTVTMFALGGVEFCTTHRVMGECPFAKGGAR